MGILVDSINAERKRRQEQKRAEWERKLTADATAAEERKRQGTSFSAPAPKTAEEKEADINRREKNRSVQYSMIPEVRAGAIKRAEAAGDTDKVRELTNAEDIERWAEEQIKTRAVKLEAKRTADEAFAAAAARGDETPWLDADAAGNEYLDLYRNAAQETRNEVYNYRQDEKRTEMEEVRGNTDFAEKVSLGEKYTSGMTYKNGMYYDSAEPFSGEAYTNRIMNFVNDDNAPEGQYGEDKARVAKMTEQEKDTIRVFAVNGEHDKVKEYYELLKRSLNKRVQDEKNKETYEKAYKNPGMGVLKNVGASFGTVGAYIDNAGNALGNMLRDEYVPTDPNTWAYGATHIAKETSRGVSDRAYDAAGGGNLGEVARFFTDTGLSMANFLSKVPLGPTGAMIAMGADAAGQTTLDVLERGGTAGQAFLLSTAAGTVEALTEKMPLDNLFKTAKEVGKTGLKTTVKSILKQAGMEATEEVVSELANTALDIAVMREKSEYQSYIAELEKSGMSRAEAEKEAFFQFFGMNLIKAGAGGALSGGIMGGGASAISAINTSTNRRRAGGGFTKTEFSKAITNKQIRALDAIGRALGVNISIGAPTGDGKGAYNGYYENGNIVIAQDAKNPLEVVLCHEVTHRMKETAPAEYNAFLELAVNASEKLSGAEKAELINRYKTAYSEGTQTEFSDIQALDEIAADFTKNIVNDISLFERLAQANKTVAQRFVDSIRDFITKVKSTFSYDKAKADTASLDKYGASISELEAAVAQFEKMLETTEAAVASGNINTAGTDADGGRQYSIEGSLLSDLQDVLTYENKNDRNELLIGTTSDFLVNELGAESLQVTMPKSKAYAAMVSESEAKRAGRYSKDLNYHELGADLLYDALVASENPVVAFVDENTVDKKNGKVEDRSNRIVLVTDKTKDGNNIVVIMQVNAPGTVNGGRVQVNKDITVFDRKSLGVDISRAMSDNRLLYFDKKRSQNISAGKLAANSPGAIQKVDFKDNISRFWANVNWKKEGGKSVFEAPEENQGTAFAEAYNAAAEKSNREFSPLIKKDNTGRELTQEQAEYFKDSKIRDKEGNLLVMYHQTGEDFTVFDVKKKGAGIKDDQTPFGIFMKTSDADIGLQGKKQMMLYANITNPLYASSREDLTQQLRRISPEFARIERELAELNQNYKKKTDKASEDIEKYLVEWRKRNPNENRTAVYDDVRYVELSEKEDALIEEWEVRDAELSLEAKNKITEALSNAGYDGVVLSSDSGSWGRITDAYIALSPEQVKSVDNANPTANPDIRYSLKTEDLLSPEYGKAVDDSSSDEESTHRRSTVPPPLGKEGVGDDGNSYIEETGLDVKEKSHAETVSRAEVTTASAPPPEGKSSEKKPRRKKDKDGKVVSQVRTNTIERSGIFSKEELQNPELAREKFKYKPVSEEETQRKARERVEAGREEALEHIKNKEGWDGADTDTAFELLKLERADAAERGNWVRVGEIARLIQKRATKAGQEIQAHAKYTRTAEKTIVEATENIENSHLVSKEDIELLKKLIKRFVNDRGELDTARMDKALTASLKEEPKVRRKRVKKVFREIISAKKEEMGKMGFLMETEKILSSHMEDTVKAQEIMKTVSGAADLIYSIKEEEVSKEKLIDLIKRQAAIRGHKISKETDKRLLGEDFEFLYETAEKQLRAITEDYIPRSLGQKLSTVQSLGQLLQVPTYLTNIISNRAFGLVDKQTANTFGIVFDRVISLATKQKTVGYEHTFRHGIHEAGKKAKNRAKINASLDVKSGEPGRYGTGTTRTFKTDESRWKVTKFLSNVEKLLTYELNVPDEAQKGRIRRSVTESLIPLVESGQMSVEEVTEIAVDEARYRTFQDDNLPSKIIGELKKVFNHIGTKDFGLGDFICKYTQVAGALIERTLEYSPGGYIKGIYNLYEMAREGINAKKQREAALAFARGTTGTGLITIGTLLSSLKIVFREDDEKDDNIRALNSAEGVVGTKINLSAMGRLLTGKSTEAKKDDVLLSVDRFEPFNMFLTAGAEIAKAENKSIGNIALTSISGATKSIRELSVIQTIDEFFTLLEYSGDKDQIALASELAIFFGESTVGSFIPSAVRRSARAFDNNYRDTYADNSEMGIALRQLGSSIPGLRNTLPEKLDNFGNAKTYTDNWLLNAGNALVAPFEVSKYKKSDVSRELERVRKETGSTSIYPAKNAPYSIKYDGEKYILHAEARERYQKMRGNTYYRLIFEALKNERYKKLNADQQAAILENFKEYATDKAKEEYFESVRVEYERDATAWDADEEKFKGVKISDFYIDKYAQGVEKKEKSVACEKTRRKALG